MLRFFFSSEGRMSRRQFWRGYCLIALAMIPSFVAVSLIPHLQWWAAAVILIASLLMASASAAALNKKRAHDLGKPSSWALWPLVPIKLLLIERQAHDNQYGPAHCTPGPRTGWRIGRWIASLGLVSIVGLGVVFYRAFAGPSWKWPDCKAAIVTEAAWVDSAKERWRQSVADRDGPVYASSGLTLMQSAACGNGMCKFSARPCVQLQ